MMTRQRGFASLVSRMTCVLAASLLATFPDAHAGSFDASLGLPRKVVVIDESLARLGERMFFDTRLSADSTVSCASCHLPERAFADKKARSRGHRQQEGTRNAPSLLNVAYLQSFFWDGRAGTLDAQARAPFINAVEHGLTGHKQLLAIVQEDQRYSTELASLRPGTGATLETVTAALVAYERTLISGGSRFDRYFYGKERSSMSDAALRGLELFRGRANCASCHTMGAHFSLFTDHSFHLAARGVPPRVSENLPTLAQRVVAASTTDSSEDLDELIARNADIAALGRFLVTLDPADIGKFKTPSLRNVADTAPYMHDGGVATLEEAVELELYNRGAVTYPIILTRSEKADLLEFLRALSGTRPTAPSATP